MAIVLMVIKSHSCQSRRLQQFSHVGQLGFLDSGNVDIVAAEESQQISDISADYVRAPSHQS